MNVKVSLSKELLDRVVPYAKPFEKPSDVITRLLLQYVPLVFPAPLANAPAPANDEELSYDESWSFKKPKFIIFQGEKIEVSTFKQILVLVACKLAKQHENFFARVPRKTAWNKNSKALLYGKLVAHGVFVETNYSANVLKLFVGELCNRFGEERPTVYAKNHTA